MKAAIYNPYLDTLGGGERYTLSFAKILSEEGYQVDIEWNDYLIKERILKRFGIKLNNNINIVDSINRGRDYDICFWVSDGSIPTLQARKNILHFQVPFTKVNGKSLLNKMKLFRIDKIICNSNFTKKIIDQEYGVNSMVIYPPVDTSIFKSKIKKNQICYIGRFSNLVQNKHHDLLIEEFKKITEFQDFKDWKLVLAGGIEVGVGNYLKNLKELSSGLNVEFVESPDVDKIADIYATSKIFWGAAGFGVNEQTNPEKTEHFGITIVEAMSAGCVPVVYNAGGAKEIIEPFKNGFLWQNKDDLIKYTNDLIINRKFKEISRMAIGQSKKFSVDMFKQRIKEII